MSLKNILEKYPRNESSLIKILLEFQDTKKDNSISESEVKEISDYLGVPESKICSVISFYSFFSFNPRGKYVILVCKDVPCFVNSQVSIKDALEESLGIKMGETTKDGLFTLEYTGCLGCCDNPPAIEISGKTYCGLTLKKVREIIDEYRRMA
ncbi:MAG TPA: NAD(P)H-dependent oxidoreductase subunit E [Bacillota bacterium]|nr:NAD(P)H-dependent oxidoreductase subunit E [Bacillota bacterium]HPF42560.1 NAD(P)H-dependent oxidoreductase subunit E [Bacillota bacterium]HPJ85882.1 NAD(P)H-dependent oxidoreductase subunit E [Bacillota bacterium]HPQ62172.1 NAD(P)H-dependent oxidoreductase subunit E [Bacillota bacterium]HRX91580.1 NAD(P)H-dependent oxidoreductase subunit E [Candidatus Izemoplasmatales bacterium]